MSKDRVETFSDGVFAIVLTLLVLELSIPPIPDHANFTTYANALAPLTPKILSFVIVFVMISIHWVSHHYFFTKLKSAPLGLIWLNNILLLWICFMPFPTALLGDHFTDKFPLFLVGINQLLAALTFFFMRLYSVKNGLIEESSVKEMGPRHSLPAVLMYFLTVVFSFIDVYLSLVCLFLVPIIYFVPNFWEGKFSKIKS